MGAVPRLSVGVGVGVAGSASPEAEICELFSWEGLFFGASVEAGAPLRWSGSVLTRRVSQ